MSSKPSATMLCVSHPGHEILSYGWLAQHKPRVCVLTDGSGSIAAPRLSETEALLSSLDCPKGAVWGPFSDQELYKSILSGQAEVFQALISDLTRSLVEDSIEVLIHDALERVILAHDLWAIVCEIAVQRARKQGQTVRRYQLPIYGYHGQRMTAPGEGLALDLNEGLFQAKKKALRFYQSHALQAEIAEFIKQRGEQSFRHERYPEALSYPDLLDDSMAPVWEQHGEAMREQGRYQEVIRLHDHLKPLATTLSEQAWAVERAG